MKTWMTIAGSCALVAMLSQPSNTFAQAQDPLIGSWYESGSLTDGSLPFIALMNFNAGGTTIETDTGGTNSSGVESINLGKWQKTAASSYTFKDQNYVWDSSGNLAYININSCRITLSNGNANFSGTCEFSLYTCSLTSCPGTLFAGPLPERIRGARF